MPSHRDPIRALIIGVAEYPALDPAQTALGADHDAVAWSAIARALGYRTDQIFVRRSPPLPKSISAPYLPPAENRKGAKAAKVLKAIQKLINSLRADPGGRGLLVYSGHGTVINGELHLCPKDTAWENGSLVNTISINQILDMIGDALPGLTVVLDCCFAGALEGSGGAGIPAAPTRVLRGSPTHADVVLLATQKRASFAEKGVVLLSACGPGQSAYAYSFRPNLALPPAPHGVFTASISALLQRWSPPNATGSVPYPIDYDTLIAHSRAFLASMDFDQSPAWTGPADAGAHHAFYGDQGDTLAAPPAIPGREISGGNESFWLGVAYNPTLGNIGTYILNTSGNPITLGVQKYTTPPEGGVTVKAPTAEAIQGIGTALVDIGLSLGQDAAVQGAGQILLIQSSDGKGTYYGFILIYSSTIFWFWVPGANNQNFMVIPPDDSLGPIVTGPRTYTMNCQSDSSQWTSTSSVVAGVTQWLISNSAGGATIGVMEMDDKNNTTWYNTTGSNFDAKNGLYFIVNDESDPLGKDPSSLYNTVNTAL